MCAVCSATDSRRVALPLRRAVTRVLPSAPRDGFPAQPASGTPPRVVFTRATRRRRTWRCGAEPPSPGRTSLCGYYVNFSGLCRCGSTASPSTRRSAATAAFSSVHTGGGQVNRCATIRKSKESAAARPFGPLRACRRGPRRDYRQRREEARPAEENAPGRAASRRRGAARAAVREGAREGGGGRPHRAPPRTAANGHRAAPAQCAPHRRNVRGPSLTLAGSRSARSPTGCPVPPAPSAG